VRYLGYVGGKVPELVLNPGLIARDQIACAMETAAKDCKAQHHTW